MKRKLLGSLIGLILSVLFLEISIRASSQLFSFYQNKRNLSQEKGDGRKKTITIVTIGESTTAVAANEKNTLLVQETSYPNYLEKYLNEKQSQYHFDVINKGVMSANSKEVIKELGSYLKTNRPNIIVAMMGMKDNNHLNGSGKKKAYWAKVDEVLQNLKIYNFACLVYYQYLQNNSNGDDTRLVNKYEDLSKEFLFGDNERDAYLNIYYHLGTNNFSDELLSHAFKDHLLANYYLKTGQFKKAQDVIKKTIAQTGFGDFLLADLFIRGNDLKNAESILKNYMKKNPANPYAYKKLMILYLNDKDLLKAEKTLTEAKINKLENTFPLLVAQSQLNKENGHFPSGILKLQNQCGVENKKSFEKRDSTKTTREEIERFSSQINYEECVYFLSELYYLSKEYDMAENNLLYFVQKYPKAYAGVELLRKVYEDQGKTELALDLIKKMSEKNFRLAEYFALADFYKHSNRQSELKNVFEASKKNFPQTAKNFEKVNQMSKNAGAKLIIMQYPTFSLEALKYLTSDLKDVYYVSNESIFDNAPKLKYFFEPRFPYKFNHYTSLGSQVIARNLANEIEKGLKEGKL